MFTLNFDLESTTLIIFTQLGLGLASVMVGMKDLIYR